MLCSMANILLLGFLIFFHFLCLNKTNHLMKNIATLFLGLFFLISSTVSAQEHLTAEHLWNLDRMSGLTASPDGNYSLYQLTSYDIESNESSSYIHLLNNQTGESKQLTFNGVESSPFWCPEGRHIGFISRRDDGPGQIFILEEGWGEARKVTDLPVGVFSPKWFPNGKRIAFGANIHPDYEGCWDTLKEIQEEQRNSKVTAKVTENYMYRFWDRWLTNGFFPRLFSVEIESGEVTDLMPNTSNYFNMMGGVSYDIHPDGEIIAVSQNSTPEPFDKLNYDIFLLKTDGSGEMTNITEENIASDLSPVFSPSGDKLLYGRQNKYHFYADNVQMVIYDMADGGHENLSAHIDLSCSGWKWSSDESTIYFHAQHNARTAIFSLPATGGEVTRLVDGGSTSALSYIGNDQLIFLNHTFTDPVDAYRVDLPAGENLHQLTNVNEEIMSSLTLGKVDDITYKGANDADVQMFIVYPPDFDDSQEYPLLMLIHGGPHGIFGDSWHYRWNAKVFAAEGYVVALPNFHGSTSFGQEFAESIHGSHAELPFRDIMKATDYMEAKSYIDESRTAAAGGSYGGYMVSWIAGHTDRYDALINHAGVYNIHMQFSADYTANRKYQYDGSPWENFDNLMAANPAMFAHNFQTPMLVIHGELDYRVPVGHGLLVYGIYKEMGLDARLVYYPDENHWILSAQNSIHWYGEFIDWLNRYLR